jgi:hypothetical protein
MTGRMKEMVCYGKNFTTICFYIKTHFLEGWHNFSKNRLTIKSLRHQCYGENFSPVYSYVRKAINWHEILTGGWQQFNRWSQII